MPVWNAANAQMPLYYSAANAMVLCSDTEGSPTSVKEALACNLPVVATDVGDVRAILSGIDGSELTAQEPQALAAALRRVLSTHDRHLFDGRSAMRRFAQAETVAALLRVYRSVQRAA
jgi:glycosyltransferase involved in cell wall biosynthesis